MALWCNWLTRRPLKAESPGSSPGNATIKSTTYAKVTITKKFRGYFGDTKCTRETSVSGPMRASPEMRLAGAAPGGDCKDVGPTCLVSIVRLGLILRQSVGGPKY